MTGNLDCDVAIVGAGYTGLSAALHLAESGVDVIVIEGEEIGFGGSGRNVGLVNAGLWIMPDDMPKLLGPEYGEGLLTLLGEAPGVVFDLIEKYSIQCEPQRSGTLHCAVGKSGLRQLQDRARQWEARGAPVRLLDAAETRSKTGSDAYSGALLDARAGTIQPLAYARGLAAAAMAAGARIYTQSEVLRVEYIATRTRVYTREGAVTAHRVIAATNAYTEYLWPEMREEMVHLPYFNFATAPLPPAVQARILPERQGAWDTKQILSSFRKDRAGRLIFGSVGSLSGTGHAVHKRWARRALARVFPDIGDVPFESGWYGTIGMTNDHLPRLHRLGPNVFAFCGYNGRGIGPGTVFGRALAEYLAGGMREECLPLPFTKPQSQNFRGSRAWFYRTGAQMAHLI